MPAGAVAIGLGALALAARASVPGLVWGDELVFAAAGRHVADGHGPLSSFYHPQAIVLRGLPQPDVHMPGQAFVLGAAFRLLGASEGAAILTSRLAFLGTLLLIVAAVGRPWGRRAALGAVLLFVLFPPNVEYAHTAMSEGVFTLLSTAFFALWMAARDRSSLALAAAMAAVLGLGAIHHETILVYVPAAAWAIARWPAPARGRGLALGTIVLAACLAAATPFYLARAPYPHALTEMMVSSDAQAVRVAALAGHLAANLRGLPIAPAQAWEWNHALQWAAMLTAAVLGLRRGGRRREVAGLALLGFLGTWVGLALVYPIGDWRAVRVFMHTMPPALAVIADALVRRPDRGWRARDLWRLVAPAAIVAVGAVSLVSIAKERRAVDAFGRAYSEFLARSTAGHDVRVLVATKAYRYGWDAYPVAIVVWQATDLAQVQAVEQVVPVDAIVIRPQERRRFRQGLMAGAYRRSFAPAPTPSFRGAYKLWLAEAPP